MDTEAFATWLGGIGLLDRAQRAEAFRALALAEADDPIDPSPHPVDAAVLVYEAAVAASLPVAERDDAAPEEALPSRPQPYREPARLVCSPSPAAHHNPPARRLTSPHDRRLDAGLWGCGFVDAAVHL